MKVFGKFKLDEKQVKEVLEQLRNTKSEMENCLHDHAVSCYELFRVPENNNVQILYWMRILKLTDNEYEIEFISEVQTSW